MANPVVFFDIAIGGQAAGRIEMTVSWQNRAWSRAMVSAVVHNKSISTKNLAKCGSYTAGRLLSIAALEFALVDAPHRRAS